MIDTLPKEIVAMAAKYQVESYFSNINYSKDTHLKKARGAEDWILLEVIHDFPKMKRFHDRLSLKDLYEVMKLSSDVDVTVEEINWGDEKEITFYIRKKK